MNLASSPRIPPNKSKGKRFGFGYEKRSAESPSVLSVRAEFLRLLLQLKPDAVSQLFKHAYDRFDELLKQQRDLISSHYASFESQIPTEAFVLRQPSVLRARAIENTVGRCYVLAAAITFTGK
jgi:hypothetical protein